MFNFGRAGSEFKTCKQTCFVFSTSTDSTWEVQKSAERKEDEVYSK